MVTTEVTTVITVMISLEFTVATGNGEGCLRIRPGYRTIMAVSFLLRGCLSGKWQARFVDGPAHISSLAPRC